MTSNNVVLSATVLPETVLVVGAGPTGLFLTLALAKQGVQVRIIDQKSGPSQQSRAMGVQARTLEFYRQLGIGESAVALGIRTGDAHVWVHGQERATFSLKEMGTGLSPYPFLLTLAQDIHERFLIEQLAACGVTVEWNTTLARLSQAEAAVTACLTQLNGTEESIAVPYLVGCDGAGSATREALDIGFGGGTSEGLFYVADVEIDRDNQDVHVGIADDTLNLMMPVRTSGMQRLIGIVPSAVSTKEDITFADVGDASARLLNVQVESVNWFSTYRVHHRVADRFKVGRCFIAGDAGHVHSPVGGQGMNTGLGDAMNLAWKLACVLNGCAAAKLLDTYEPERIAFARQLISSTDSAFQKMVAEGKLAQILRTVIAPRLVWLLTRFQATKRVLFKTVSQIQITYPDSRLSVGRRGQISPGDRLPFVANIDNHRPLERLDWQLHVYGAVSQSLAEKAQALSLPITAFPFSSAVNRAGFIRNAAYLLRPDGYIALILPSQELQPLANYQQDWSLTFASLSPKNLDAVVA